MAQTINVNTTPGQFMPTLYYSQGDIGREFEIVLASSDGWSIPAGATVTMVATKPSGFGFSVAGTLTDNVASFTTTETMTNEWGRFPAEIRITSSGDVIGTANFYLSGERDPHPAGTTDGDAEEIIPELTVLVERVEAAASSVLDMTVVANTLPAGSAATYSYDEETNTATFGIPKGADGSLASGVLAPTYSTSKTYAVGDYVYYSGNLYRCTTAITTAEAWTSGHWTQVAIAPEVSDVKSDFHNYLYGVNETFTHTGSTAWDYWLCLLLEGVKYTVTSDDGVTNVRIYKPDNSRIDVGTIPSGGSLTFTVPTDEYVRIGAYLGNGKSITVTNEFYGLTEPQTMYEKSDADLSVIRNLKDETFNDDWAQGSLNSGTETASNYRIRTGYIPFAKGTVINFALTSGFLYEIDYYNSSKQYQSDTGWLSANKVIEATSDGYIRVLLRYSGNNVNITPDKGTNLTINTTYLIVGTVKSLGASLDGNRPIDVEIGTIVSGVPSSASTYIRSKDFLWANKGDTLTLAPSGDQISAGCIYFYDVADESGYANSNVDIPTTASGATYKYIFQSDCYFKVRGNVGRTLGLEDLYSLNNFFSISQLYSISKNLIAENTLGVDVDSINTSIAGKVNIALQTDTHMSAYVGYSTSKYAESDYGKLEKVANTINKLDIDVFANLGDWIRGYGFDPDFQTRESIDKMIACYKKINTNKAFVIGNHDDGNMYYSGSYNDKQSVDNVLFPTEQFNRIVKYGLNNMGKTNYWYADISGIRFISLYQRDFDYASAVPAIEAFKIGSTQLSWLVNTALDTSLPVVVLTHAPLVSNLYATSRVGFDDVLTALSDFMSGGGTVIAVLSGHTHEQDSAVVDGINHIVFDDGYSWFELISIDLDNSTITCKAINKSLADMNFTF